MAWVNADDTYFPHTFSTAAKAFKHIPEMEWFGGAIAGLYESGVLKVFPEYYQPYPAELIRGYCCGSGHWRVLQQNGMFWKGALWQKAGPLDATLRYAGDFELWPRFARYAEFLHLPVVLGTFRFREGQLSRNAQYSMEMEQVCPKAVRDAAARAFWQKQKGKGPLLAPALRLDENGIFFSCQQETFQDTTAQYGEWWKRILRSVLPKKVIAVIKRWRQHVCRGRQR
jgi:hypothetical protein